MAQKAKEEEYAKMRELLVRARNPVFEKQHRDCLHNWDRQSGFFGFDEYRDNDANLQEFDFLLDVAEQFDGRRNLFLPGEISCVCNLPFFVEADVTKLIEQYHGESIWTPHICIRWIPRHNQEQADAIWQAAVKRGRMSSVEDASVFYLRPGERQLCWAFAHSSCSYRNVHMNPLGGAWYNEPLSFVVCILRSIWRYSKVRPRVVPVGL